MRHTCMSPSRTRPSHSIRLFNACAVLAVAGSLASCEMPQKASVPANAAHEAKKETSKAIETPAPVARSKSAIGGGEVDTGATAREIEAWLQAHVDSDKRSVATRTRFEVVAEGKHWRVSFPDRLLAPNQPVAIEIVRHPAMTVMMAPMLRVPKNPPAEMLGALLAQNYELYQAKLSLGPQGDLYVSYEVPNRLLDQQELIDDVEDLSLLAQNLTGLVEQRLVELALGMRPEGAQPQQQQVGPSNMPSNLPPPGGLPPGPDVAQGIPPHALPPAAGIPPSPPNAHPPSAPLAGQPRH